jgi:hypothetical protein
MSILWKGIHSPQQPQGASPIFAHASGRNESSHIDCSRSTFTATQASVVSVNSFCTVSAIIITPAADAATPQRSNAPLKDATARSAYRATCVATPAHICSRETRLARAKAKKRARRVLRSHRQPSRSSRCFLLDEPRMRPANPAERGDHHDDASLLYSAHSLSGLDWTGMLRLRHNNVFFSSCNAQHDKLIYGIRHSDCHICIAIYSANLFACHPRVTGGKPVR